MGTEGYGWVRMGTEEYGGVRRSTEEYGWVRRGMEKNIKKRTSIAESPFYFETFSEINFYLLTGARKTSSKSNSPNTQIPKTCLSFSASPGWAKSNFA